MAVVNVDYSEFETLKNRVKELEETVKEKDKTIASLKDGSRVIIRKEVQIEYERSTFDIICGSQHERLQEAQLRQIKREHDGLHKWITIKPNLRLLCRIDEHGKLLPIEQERINKIKKTLGIK